MNRSRAVFPFFVAVVVLLGWAPAAHAQFNRVFASARSGNDANSCNNINTPCQTFQGAVNQVAAGGSVIVLDSGGYGPVTITKALTLEAPPGIVAFIHPPSGDALTVNAGTSDVVVLRGLTLNVGPNNGINATSVGSLHIENCLINGFSGNGIQFQAAGRLFVKDTTVRDSTSWGIVVEPSGGTAQVAISRCRLANGGLFVRNGTNVSVSDSVASGGGIGFVAQAFAGGSAQLNMENCLASNNSVAGIRAEGIDPSSNAVVRVSNSTVTNNGTGLWQITFSGGSSSLLSRINNTVEGNGTNTSGTITPFAAR